MNDGKVVLITGSSRGLGAGFAKHLAKRGCKIVINYASSEAEAAQLYQEIAQYGGEENILSIQADVSNRQAVISMFDTIMEKFGRVDVLINNAGINIDKPFLELGDDDWHTVINTNLTGTFICSQEFARRFASDELGHIINLGAITGIQGRKNGANYCSSKAGIITLTKCLALELAPQILVNCVLPGTMNTEEVMERYNLHDSETREKFINTIPMRRIGTVEEVCVMVDFIIDKVNYSTGQKFFVDGGLVMH
ncbi:MAG: 3-oxoacyl-ACP reductase FabG [Proteobacteria bacterium]|nr:3-oxoacyl-ACP reductase FabG [Pseudomonadota bacterium]